MKKTGKLIAAGCAAFALLQLMRPGIPDSPSPAEVQASPEARHILQKDCYSCHSNQRRLAWFDEVVPAYWLVRQDVLTARRHLNFSTLGSEPAPAQRARLFEAVNMIQLGSMPLAQFTALHPEARVTPAELEALKTYLSPWSTPPGRSASPAPADAEAAPAPVALGAVALEPNGVPFDATFESWKPMSTTDRGDNNTFRFILGNEIAANAARSGSISPWPEGARFAKIAWHQETGSDGLIHPGKFIQVELMVKASQEHKDTEGWAWGRWRGMSLRPYGTDARFVEECTGCHQPVHGNDYVYTLPITMAKANSADTVNNAAAALPATLPYQPLVWSAVTMYVDPKNRTTATLFGNDVAIRAVRASQAAAGGRTAPFVYPMGSVLALVTWAQRDDPHWFGARIPDVPLSAEFVRTSAPGDGPGYRSFAGVGLAEVPSPANDSGARAKFILGLAPVELP